MIVYIGIFFFGIFAALGITVVIRMLAMSFHNKRRIPREALAVQHAKAAEFAHREAMQENARLKAQLAAIHGPDDVPEESHVGDEPDEEFAFPRPPP